MNLIDKDTLVVEIDKRLDELWDLLPNASDVIEDNYTKEEANVTGKYTALESFENFINTLEVKEVDLEKEISNYLYSHLGRPRMELELDWTQYDIKCKADKLIAFTKYFFELGIKVQN